MNDKQFQEQYLPKIKATFDFALNNPYSDFYRKKYSGLGFDPLGISTYDEFQKIPPLTKDEIVSTTVAERIFAGPEDPLFYSSSSGTTNQNKPFINAHLRNRGDNALKHGLFEEEMAALGVTKFILLVPPTSNLYRRFMADPPKLLTPVSGIASNLDLTAVLMKELKVEGIFSNATLTIQLIDKLKKIGFDLKTVKAVSIGGEACTKLQRDFLERNFPSAKIFFRYGNSEVADSIGYRCCHLFGAESSLYHPNPRFLAEILDEEENFLTEAPGEIVLTELDPPRAFPFIRYKTGDLASISDKSCPCGHNLELKSLGRKKFDVLKFSGYTLYAQLVDYALQPISGLIEPYFQFHVYERTANDKPIPQLEIDIVAISPLNSADTAEKIRDSLYRNLYLSQTKTLGDFINEKRMLPLKVNILEKIPADAQKNKSIISHLS